MEYFHSVTLDKSRCHGCTNCITNCPTEAIRVQGGKAKIIKERCIDCGECIRVCQSHAKIAAADDFSRLESYKYKIAMPAPSFYGQFLTQHSIGKILAAFKNVGFDHVFEVARGAEYVSAATRELLKCGTLKKPVISSACPAVLRLIRERFPNLLGNVLPLLSPMEVAAILAREEAMEKTGLSPNEIGVFFISPCPAKVTAVKAPITLEKSNVDGVITAKDAFMKIRPIIENIKEETLSLSGYEGIFWASSGGECLASGVEDYMAVDGIHNVINVLEEIEYGKMNCIDFIELAACTSGCSGGPLNVTNPFLASRRIAQQSKTKPKIRNTKNVDISALKWQKEIEVAPVTPLDKDFGEAMRKMELMDEVYAKLPKLDCGSCGSPNCKSLAEDIARGFAGENDCVFLMRDKVRELAKELFELNENYRGFNKKEE